MATQQTTIFDELKPFADMVIDQGRGVVVSDLAFASAEDRYSTAGITLAALVLPANSSVKLFQKNIGESGQGFTGNFTAAETNNTNGARQPANQVYIATHLGFQICGYQSGAAFTVMAWTNPNNVYIVGMSTTWSLTVGDGIKRTLGTIIEYPAGSGVEGSLYHTNSSVGGNGAANTLRSSGWANNGFSGAHKRKLPIPIVFPPNVQVDIELLTGAAQTLVENLGSITLNTAPANKDGTPFITGTVVGIKATFKGFRMTLPA